MYAPVARPSFGVMDFVLIKNAINNLIIKLFIVIVIMYINCIDSID